MMSSRDSCGVVSRLETKNLIMRTHLYLLIVTVNVLSYLTNNCAVEIVNLIRAIRTRNRNRRKYSESTSPTGIQKPEVHVPDLKPLSLY